MKTNKLLFTLLTALLFIGCEKEELDPITDPLSEIKQTFSQYNGDAIGLPSQFEIQWDEMTEKDGMMIFPAISAFKVHASDTFQRFDGDINYELVVTRPDRERGKPKVRIAKLRPFDHSPVFTGKKLLFGMDGILEAELHVEHGRLIREVSVDPDASHEEAKINLKNRKFVSCQIVFVTVFHYTDWYRVGADGSLTFTNTQFDGTSVETTTICTDDSPIFDNPTPDDKADCRCGGGSGGPREVKETTDKYLCPEGYVRVSPVIDGCIPYLDETGFKICNRYVEFDKLPQNDDESSFTGEVQRIQVPAIHTKTGEELEAFWGAWCVTYGTSATNVTNSSQASEIFKEAWELSTIEVEVWLNGQGSNPGNIAFSNQFLYLFEENLSILSGGYVKISAGGCSGSVSTTWLTYCN